LRLLFASRFVGEKRQADVMWANRSNVSDL
jgi:hypothetical protein